MEARIAKEFDGSGRVVPGVKRMRASCYASNFHGASRMVLPEWFIRNPTHKLEKRKKLDGCQSKHVSCGHQSRRPLLRCYSNFLRTGVLQRLMCYQNGEWTDFPKDLVALVRKDLQGKKPVVEVELEGNRYVINFLHMLQLDMKTGIQQPIAWIDEAGSCFFPEVYADEDEPHLCCQHDCVKDQGSTFREPLGPQEIKLKLEIDINGGDQSKLKEYSRGSNALVKHIQIAQNPTSDHYLVEAEDSCNRKPGEKTDEVTVEIRQCKANLDTETVSTSGDGCFSMLARLDGHKNAVCGITLPAGSDKLFTGSTDGTVRIWNCHSGKCNEVINLGAEIGCLISEGPWVFIGLPNRVKVWNLKGENINGFSLEGPVGQVNALAVYKDLLFAGAADGDILAWKGSSEANPFTLVATIKAHKQAVVCLCVGIGANLMYSGSMDNTVKVWDIETRQCKQTLKEHNGVVMSLFPWQQFLLTCSSDQTIKVWAMNDEGHLELVRTHEEKHGILDAFGMHDAQGKPVLFCSCNDNCVRLYELDSFTERGRIFAKKEVREIQMGPGGQFFTGDATGMVTVWNWSREK